MHTPSRPTLYAEYRALLQHVGTPTKHGLGISPFMRFGCRCLPVQGHRAVVIGLAGPKGCGKSTVAEALRVALNEEHVNAYRYRFAQPIKDMARALGLTEAQVDGAEKETPCELLAMLTPRDVMQTLGTQWGRDTISPDLWVNVTMSRVDIQSDAVAIIDDVRFPNEVVAIQARGGYIIELLRHGAEYDVSHPSEAGLPRDLIDVTLANEADPRAVALEALVYVANCRTNSLGGGEP